MIVFFFLTVLLGIRSFTVGMTNCDPADNFLSKIVIGPIKKFCLPISGTDEVCVTELTCSHFGLGSIVSTYVTTYTIFVDIGNIAMTCSGNWSLKATNGSDDQVLFSFGEVEMLLSNFSTTFNLGLTASTSTPAVPWSMLFSDCDTTGSIVDIKFAQGGLMGFFLNHFVASKLDKLIQTSMDWFICDQIGPLAAGIFTRFIEQDINPVRIEVISASAIPPGVNMLGYLNWNVSFLQNIHRLTDAVRFNSGALLRCVMELPTRSQHETVINRIKQIIMTPLMIPITGVNFSFADYDLIVETISISGLFSVEGLNLLEPISDSNVGLRSTANFGSLSIQLTTLMIANGNSEACSSHPHPYSQRAAIEFDLLNVNVTVDLVAALNLTTLGGLFGDQLLSMECIATALDALYISSFEIDAEPDLFSIRLVPGGGATSLEKDISMFMQSYAQILTSDYAPMMSSMIKGAAQKFIPDYINAKLNIIRDSWLQTECSRHGNYTGTDWQEWTNSTLVNDLDFFLNTLLGADGLNNMVDCVTNGTGSLELDIPPTAPVLAGFTVTIHGLDTFNNFAVAFPIADEPYDLGTALALGACPSSNGENANGPDECTPMLIQLSGTESNGENLVLSLSLSNVELFADIIFEVDLNILRNMQVATCLFYLSLTWLFDII